jgi:hypothetical protein
MKFPINTLQQGAIGIPGVVNKSGQTYLDRYDINIKGIEGRLKAHYKSNIIKTFGPFHISIVGDNHKYKQIFYAIEQPPTNTSNATTPTTIKANSMNELRTKLQTETKNISIDPNTITFNSSDFSVSFNPGNTMIKSMSIIYDNEEQLDNRITNSLLPKNPTMVVAKKDTSNTALQWAIVYFT